MCGQVRGEGIVTLRSHLRNSTARRWLIFTRLLCVSIRQIEEPSAPGVGEQDCSIRAIRPEIYVSARASGVLRRSRRAQLCTTSRTSSQSSTLVQHSPAPPSAPSIVRAARPRPRGPLGEEQPRAVEGHRERKTNICGSARAPQRDDAAERSGAWDAEQNMPRAQGDRHPSAEE